MAGFIVDNNVESLVADSPLAAGATTLNITPGDGSEFPSTFPFMLTIWDEVIYPDPTDDTGMEIVRCTGRTTDALTVVRGEESTGAIEHANGERVAMLITAGIFNATTYGIQPQIDALSSYFIRTGTTITTKTAGDTLKLEDDQVIALGTDVDAKLLWETADANANYVMVVLPEGGAVNVPVLAIGDGSISGQDLGFFNGVTEPRIAVIDDDLDSHAGLGFVEDDVVGLIMGGAMKAIQATNGSTKVMQIGITSSNKSVFIGKDAGLAATVNKIVLLSDIAIGNEAGKSLCTSAGASNSNILIGWRAGYNIDLGGSNICIGSGSGQDLVNAVSNILIGTSAGIVLTGNDNICIGDTSGEKNITGTNCIFLGNSSGLDETGSHKLFIDSLDRTSEALGRTNALIYGIFNLAPASQELHFNAKVQAHGKIPLTKTDNYTITVNDFGKSLRMNSAADKTFTFPSVGATDDGTRITISKLGAGKVTLQMVDTDYIHDSSATGTIYNSTAGETYATITAEYCHTTTTWNLISSVGTWVTT